MFLKSTAIIVLLIDCSIALSVLTGNNGLPSAPAVGQPSNPSDIVPSANFNFNCRCAMKGSPLPPTPEETTSTEQPIDESSSQQPIDQSSSQQPIDQSSTEQPIDQSSSQQPIDSTDSTITPSSPQSQTDGSSSFGPSRLFPGMSRPSGLPTASPFDSNAGQQLPDKLPEMPNPNQPEPQSSSGAPNPSGPFQPFQPFQPFRPFPGTQKIPNIEKLGSFLQSLTGLDCTCSGDLSPRQNIWTPFSSRFPFGFGNN